jgi:DNA polymerase III epsilon subunit-like protein
MECRFLQPLGQLLHIPLAKKMVLIFDTETASEVKNWNAPATDLENWPRVVQLAYELYTVEGERTAQGEYLIAPKGFSITPAAMAVHGITTEIALRDGQGVESALQDFLAVLDQAEYLVAHNMSFDWPVLNAELARAGLQNPMGRKKLICTMKDTQDFCAIPGAYGGYKWPKLQELHSKLFGTGFSDAHHAASDVAATAKCFWELHRRGVLQLDSGVEIRELSPMAESLLGQALEYCRSNEFDGIPVGAKAAAISFLATNFKRIPAGADASTEFGILRKMYPDESHPVLDNKKLTGAQETFAFNLKKEIIAEHKALSVFQGEKNKTLEEKMMSLDVLALLLPSDSKRLRDLVVKLYYYYLIRYADSLPEGAELYEDKPAAPHDYTNVSAAAKQAHEHLNQLTERFLADGDTVRNGGIPDHVYKLVVAGAKDLATLKAEVSVAHPLYQSASTTLIEYAVGVLVEWMKSMPTDIIRMTIQGLSYGRNLQELSFHILGKIAQLEMSEDARKWYTHMSRSVGYAPSSLQAPSEQKEKKGFWKGLFG